MKSKDFFDEVQAKRYMKEVVLRLNEIPIFVLYAEPGGNKKSPYVLKYIEAGDDLPKIKTVNINHPKLNWNPVPLGWAAIREPKKSSAYIARIPNRTQHMGLCESNISVSVPEDYNKNYNQFYRKTFLYSQCMKDTVMRNYLSIQEAAELAAKDNEAIIPFSRRFAIYKGNTILYKWYTIPVGEVTNNGDVALFPSHEFLKEAFKLATR